MRRLMIVMLVALVGLAIACGEPSPKPAEIILTGAQTGQGMWPEMKRFNRACTFPGEVIKTPDGEDYLLTHGTAVEILEQDDCFAPTGGAVKIRVVDTGIVGWLQAKFVVEK